MFERPRSGERALLVHITLNYLSEQASLEEFITLAYSAGVTPVAQITGRRQLPDPGLFIGTGKLEEMTTVITTQHVEVVLFNHTLTPAQERNLERLLQCRVVDRNSLILDIFSQRARSFEGKLQVELAQLQHLSTRLIRGWTHLERQKGGIGLRGPGETQLETDRRLIAARIKSIHNRLEKVRQQRQLSRKERQRAQLPVISLVGYTNAGKSTLFNRLTTAHAYTANQLFATLDTTLRRVHLTEHCTVIMADTVGFIQQLPPDLIKAFQATLEEIRQAQLLIHVVDAHDPERQLRMHQVNQILTELQAHTLPQIIVYNKIDKTDKQNAYTERDHQGHIKQIGLSALNGKGIELLKAAILEHLNPNMVQRWVQIPAQAGRLRARLFALGTILQEHYNDNGDSILEIQIPAEDLMQLTMMDLKILPINPLARLSQPS
ncbi:MAG: ribosome rescue GTPase HflX [Pseudomonadota bacterium]|nr:ribosome rescue GTPase HflX [Pseudomonadota bacterium]